MRALLRGTLLLLCATLACSDDDSGGATATPTPSPDPTPAATPTPPPGTPTPTPMVSPSAEASPSATPTPQVTPTPEATPLPPGPVGLSVVRVSERYAIFDARPPAPLELSRFRACYRNPGATGPDDRARLLGLAFKHLSNGPVTLQVEMDGEPVLSAPLEVENGEEFSVAAGDGTLVDLAPGTCADFTLALVEDAPEWTTYSRFELVGFQTTVDLYFERHVNRPVPFDEELTLLGTHVVLERKQRVNTTMTPWPAEIVMVDALNREWQLLLLDIWTQGDETFELNRVDLLYDSDGQLPHEVILRLWDYADPYGGVYRSDFPLVLESSSPERSLPLAMDFPPLRRVRAWVIGGFNGDQSYAQLSAVAMGGIGDIHHRRFHTQGYQSSEAEAFVPLQGSFFQIPDGMPMDQPPPGPFLRMTSFQGGHNAFSRVQISPHAIADDDGYDFMSLRIDVLVGDEEDVNAIRVRAGGDYETSVDLRIRNCYVGSVLQTPSLTLRSGESGVYELGSIWPQRLCFNLRGDLTQQGETSFQLFIEGIEADDNFAVLGGGLTPDSWYSPLFPPDGQSALLRIVAPHLQEEGERAAQMPVREIAVNSEEQDVLLSRFCMRGHDGDMLVRSLIFEHQAQKLFAPFDRLRVETGNLTMLLVNWDRVQGRFDAPPGLEVEIRDGALRCFEVFGSDPTEEAHVNMTLSALQAVAEQTESPFVDVKAEDGQTLSVNPIPGMPIDIVGE